MARGWGHGRYRPFSSPVRSFRGEPRGGGTLRNALRVQVDIRLAGQGEANEMERLLGGRPTGPLPNAPSGAYGSRLPGCRRASSRGSCGCAVDSGGMAAGCDIEQRGAADRSLPAQSSQHPAGVAPSRSSVVEACRSTEGVDFKIKTVELRGKKIRLQIWDTAGQERFNSITSAYYRSAKGIILVYDITKKETFDDLPKWMKMIDKYASEDAELLLVGNKLDCETDREISRQQGEKFAQQITGMRFCEASAKDNFNVDEIFLKLVDDILKKMPLDVLRNELSNSILSLQPEPEIPPELPPPRPHVRCC
nr:ras-related protein Rab-12 [Vicugna pacos]